MGSESFVGSLSRGVKIARLFQVGLLCYLGLNSGRPVSINVNKTRKHFSRNIHGVRMFLQCSPVSHMGNTVSSVSFCFQDANCPYASRQGILTKIRACEHLQKASNSSKGKILWAWPSKQFEQRANFASSFKLDGTIWYPYITNVTLFGYFVKPMLRYLFFFLSFLFFNFTLPQTYNIYNYIFIH